MSSAERVRAVAAGRARPRGAPAGRAAGRGPDGVEGVLALQRAAGNRAVGALMRSPAPAGPSTPRVAIKDRRIADERERTIATIEVVGHASPRWRAAGSPEEADARNMQLAERRAAAVELAIEDLLSDMLPGTVVFQPIVSSRMDEPDALTEPADVSIGGESRGSTETLVEAGEEGRAANRPQMLRVDVRVTLRSAEETTFDEDVSETTTKPGATKDWGLSFMAEAGIEVGLKGGAFLVLMRNNLTGEVGTYAGTKAGGGLGVGVSIAKTQMPDFEGVWMPEEMTFADFDGAVFTIASSGFSLGIGWESSTLWFRSFPNGEETPDGISVGGFTMGGIGLNIGSVESGVMALIDRPSETYEQTIDFTRRRVEVNRSRMETTHRVLFETGSERISPEQENALRAYLEQQAAFLR